MKNLYGASLYNEHLIPCYENIQFVLNQCFHSEEKKERRLNWNSIKWCDRKRERVGEGKASEGEKDYEILRKLREKNHARVK